MRRITFFKLPIVAGKDANKFLETDKRSSLTNWPTREKINSVNTNKQRKVPLNKCQENK